MDLPVRCQLTILGVALLLLANAGAAQIISGTVTAAGAPLAGVSVVVEVDGRQSGKTATDDQGRFSVDLHTAGNPRDVQLTFTRTDFVVASHLLEPAALARPLNVVLMPVGGPANLTLEEQEKLKALVSGGLGPLLFAPYTLPDNVTQTAGPNINERLRGQLERLILTHVQSAVPKGDARSVALAPLPLPVSADLQHLRALGEYTNALAVVSGQGFPEVGTTDQKLTLQSQYLVIPRTTAFDPPVLYIADTVPAAAVGRMSLDARMSRMWGRATVLALAARDVRGALTVSDRAQRTAELRRIQSYLLAERKNVGATDTLGEVKLKQLLDLVDEELKR